MLTKELITELKNKGNGDLSYLIDKQKDSGGIVFILENLGHLPKNFNGEFLVPLLKYEHHQVRLLAVKNIAKLGNEKFLPELMQMLDNETNTSVKREVVSAIGRLRNPKNKEILYKILQDEDPKIVCQAIRALLVFENDKEVEERLKPLVNHPNEMVRTVIYKEFFIAYQFYPEKPCVYFANYFRNNPKFTLKSIIFYKDIKPNGFKNAKSV